MALEPRMLFDGAAAASVDLAHEAAADSLHAGDAGYVFADAPPAVHDTASAAPAGAPALLIIDPSVEDWQALVADAADNTIVRVLDPERDGVSQIAQAVLEIGQISSLHVVSHGEAGALNLGSRTVDLSTLDQYAGDWATIGAALGENGDLLLYGCDVGKGQLGTDFIAALARATHADVAASTDATGAAALGGDWDLEASVGSIETGIAFGARTIEQWNHLLLSVAPELSIVATDRAETSGTDVIEGETVRMRYVVELVDGTDTNAIVRPNLPTGLRYVNDGQTTVGIVSDLGATSSTLGSGPAIADSGSPLTPGEISATPSFVLPGSAITDGGGSPLAAGLQASGADPEFRLGDLTNNDGSDGDREFIVIEFNVRVASDGASPLITDGTYNANAIDQGTSNTVSVDRLQLVTGTLWDDTLNYNQNIDSSPAENRLSGVNVDILFAGADNTFGTGDDLAGSTTSDGAGAYAFGPLGAGIYRVSVATAVTDAASGPVRVYFDRAGSGSMTDGVAEFTLGTGESRTELDFGFVKQNATPTLSAPSSLTAQQDTALAINGANAISSDDPDLAESFNPTTSFSVQLDVASGTLALSASGGASITGNGSASVRVDGSMTDLNATLASLVYQGNTGYSGTDTLNIRVDDHGSVGDADGDGVPGETVDDNLSATASVAITVNAAPVVNAAPSANNDTRSTDEDSAISGNAIAPSVAQQSMGDVADTDPDLPGDMLQACGVAAGVAAGPLSGQIGATVAGSWGDLVLQADGSYSYSPNAAANALVSGQNVQDVFTYTICDSAGATSTARLIVNVSGLDETSGAPVANPDLRTITAPPAGTPASVSGNAIVAGQTGEQADTDPDGDPLVVSGVQAGVTLSPAAAGVGATIAGQWGSLQMSADGSYLYALGAQATSLGPAQVADDVFSYEVRDPAGHVAATTLTVRITGINDAPSAPNASYVIALDARAGTDECRIPSVPLPSDPDLPPQVLTTVVSALPPVAQGQFLLNGVPLVIGQQLSNADLQALCFVPDPGLAQQLAAGASLPTSVLGLTVTDDQGASAQGAITIGLAPRAIAPADDGGPGRPGKPGSAGGSPFAPVPGIGQSDLDLSPMPAAPGNGRNPIVAGFVESAQASREALLPATPELDPLSPLSLLGDRLRAERDALEQARARAAAVKGDASQAVAAADDCVPGTNARPKLHAVKRSVLSDERGAPARGFTEQLQKESKRFKPPAKVRLRATPGRIC